MSELKLKRAQKKDCLFIFNAFNLGVKAGVFKTKKVISYKEHKAWFLNVLKNKEIILFLCFRKNKKIGYIKFNKCLKKSAKVSIILSPNFRRRGVASIFLKKSIKIISHKENVEVLYAEILKKNIASKNFFLKNNFENIKIRNKAINKIFNNKNFLYTFKISQ